jgi:hypothetical protein
MSRCDYQRITQECCSAGKLRIQTKVPALVLVIVITLLLGLLSTEALAQAQDEYQVKAAFLFNFVKFVEWPAEAFSDSNAPLIIGVVGDDRFQGSIDQMISGRIANGRRLLVKRFSNFRTLTPCHIVFVSSSERDNIQQILATAGPGALTVGESDRFAQMGGIINFTVVDRKVRLEINQAAAERRGLRISAKLLSLARVIRN